MDAKKWTLGSAAINQKLKRGLNFLIVEDDLTWEPIWSHLLHRVGLPIRYDWATSILEAKVLMQRADDGCWHYDLVITDIFVSGGQTGLELMQGLSPKALRRLILVSSANTELLRAHVDSLKSKVPILQKPFSEEQGLAAIHCVLQRDHEGSALETLGMSHGELANRAL